MIRSSSEKTVSGLFRLVNTSSYGSPLALVWPMSASMDSQDEHQEGRLAKALYSGTVLVSCGCVRSESGDEH